MFYNETQIAPECSLAKISGSGIYSIVTLDCYFNLEEEIKGRDDLLNYDIRIGQDINKNKVIINSKQEINLFGFDNKQTLTLLGKNIIRKPKPDYIDENNETSTKITKREKRSNPIKKKIKKHKTKKEKENKKCQSENLYEKKYKKKNNSN